MRSPSSFLLHSGPALLFALVFQAAYPVFADGTGFDFRRASAAAFAGPAPVPAPLPLGLPPASGKSSGPRMIRMEPARFNAFVASHPGQGRLLTGAELASAQAPKAAPAKVPVRNSAAARPVKKDSGPVLDYPAIAAACDSMPIGVRPHCRDSVKAKILASSMRSGALYSENDLIQSYIDAQNTPDTNIHPPFIFVGPRTLPPRPPDRPSQRELAALEIDTPSADTSGPRALRELKAKDAARRDTLARAQGNRQDTLRIETRRYDSQAKDAPDTLVIGQAREEAGDNNERDARKADEEETTNWFVNLMVDFRDGGTGGGGGGWSGDDLAAVIYVVVGVVVVGAFLIYGIQTLTELAVNPKDDPLFQEVGLRLSYSGHPLRDGTGPDLYRDSYLAGLRYAVGFDRPGMDIGLAIEGGYIDVNLHEEGAPLHSFDFQGGYLVAGPVLRFGDYDPLSFNLEFLNGASNHQSIGWISKSRMTLQARVGGHATLGGHLGAVFYDLQFLDGLGWRRGDFNRDLSLITGLDMGWEF